MHCEVWGLVFVFERADKLRFANDTLRVVARGVFPEFASR